jgi:hypothetical protein
VSRYEEPARQDICLNGHWRFQGDRDRSVPGDMLPTLGGVGPDRDQDSIAGWRFDFKNGMISGDVERAFAYLAVWIRSCKPLNDLLSEPNLPRLSFTYGSDDGCELWLNGELLAVHERTGPLEPEAFAENPLLLRLGWNQLVIKVVQDTGEWKFAGESGCLDLGFLQKLEYATEKPAAH